jgi:hypothetical protein
MGKRLMENSGSRVAIWRVRDKHVCWNIPRRDFDRKSKPRLSRWPGPEVACEIRHVCCA